MFPYLNTCSDYAQPMYRISQCSSVIMELWHWWEISWIEESIICIYLFSCWRRLSLSLGSDFGYIGNHYSQDTLEIMGIFTGYLTWHLIGTYRCLCIKEGAQCSELSRFRESMHGIYKTIWKEIKINHEGVRLRPGPLFSATIILKRIHEFEAESNFKDNVILHFPHPYPYPQLFSMT